MIFVECYNDIDLLLALNLTRNDINHSGNNSSVLIDMNRHNGQTLSIIDEDPNSIPIPQLYDFELVEESFQLKLLNHKSMDDHKLIIIPENLELWIQKLARQENIELSSFGLLTQRGKMKKRYTRVRRSRLFELFISNRDNNSLKQLIEWVGRYG
ncbi:MAG: hypothetical protein ACC656_05970 [Candidatus Heimdallarchaeota archaeon]